MHPFTVGRTFRASHRFQFMSEQIFFHHLHLFLSNVIVLFLFWNSESLCGSIIPWCWTHISLSLSSATKKQADKAKGETKKQIQTGCRWNYFDAQRLNFGAAFALFQSENKNTYLGGFGSGLRSLGSWGPMKTGHSGTSWTELEPVLSDCLWQVQSCGVVVAFSAQICGTVLFSHLSSVSLRMMGCGSVWQGRCYTEPAVCFQSPSVCWQILKWKPLSTTKKCTLAAWCQTAAVLSSASETVLYRWLDTNLDMCACPHTHTHTIIPKHTHTHTQPLIC